jgi:HTH-type transcriptional regulator/antitoxin HipB
MLKMPRNVERKSSPIHRGGESTGGIAEHLRRDLARPEFSEGYAESFQDAYVATQIKVLREQHQLTQAKLAEKLHTTQTVISRIENVNYSAWNISTLKKLARAFRVRLKVSFETYGSLIHDMEHFTREDLQRIPREEDPELLGSDEERNSSAAVLGTGAADCAKISGLSMFAGIEHPELRAELLKPQGQPVQRQGRIFGAADAAIPA